MASLTFDQIVYAGHPYSRPEDGYPTCRQSGGTTWQPSIRCGHGRAAPTTWQSSVRSIRPGRGKAARVLGDWENPSQPEPPELPR